jgi:diguanylate cyclase (GGDEF)-like protein
VVSTVALDLGSAPARPADRFRASIVAGLLAACSALVVPVIVRPVGASYPVFAIVIALSIAAVAVTAVLLWAQARVTRSLSLSVLACGYAVTAIVMLPYLLFYRGLWPQLIAWISADPQTSAWLWVEWHVAFIGTTIAYYLVRARQAAAPPLDAAAFGVAQRRLLWASVAALALTVPPLIWIDGLPALSRDGASTPLLDGLAVVLCAGALASIWLAYRTNRFRTVLDIWLSIACLSMLADVLLSHFSHQFAAGWYASRLSILLAASAVLIVLLFQTANIYAELAVTAERLRDESLTDVLTGLANRRNFDVRFSAVLRECARDLRPVALLAIDVDHFKAYNDTFGHQAGDECLRRVAAVLQQNVGRARDLVARTGGEEMAVIMPDADLTGALIVANRMRAAVHNAAIPQGSAAAHPVVTISLGVAATRDPAATSTAALAAAADRALYRAKREGRNRVAESVEPFAPAGLPDA